MAAGTGPPHFLGQSAAAETDPDPVEVETDPDLAVVAAVTGPLHFLGQSAAAETGPDPAEVGIGPDLAAETGQVAEIDQDPAAETGQVAETDLPGAAEIGLGAAAPAPSGSGPVAETGPAVVIDLPGAATTTPATATGPGATATITGERATATGATATGELAGETTSVLETSVAAIPSARATPSSMAEAEEAGAAVGAAAVVAGGGGYSSGYRGVVNNNYFGGGWGGWSVLRQLVSRRLGKQRLVLDGIRHRRPTSFGLGALGAGTGRVRLRLSRLFRLRNLQLLSDLGYEQVQRLGPGLGGEQLAVQRLQNPYYATFVAAQPAQTTVVYDYSQPINVTAAPPDASVAESTEQVFSAARDAFKAGDYQRALDLTDQVLKRLPTSPVVHEFRALCLFALKRYDEAAAVEYAVLSAGPGWNWSTLVGLYPDVDTYTNQLRALEAYGPEQSELAFSRVSARLPLHG